VGFASRNVPPKRLNPTRSRINAEYAKLWPNITNKREAPADAKEFDGRAGKYDAFFSPKPGEGD
jgi:ferredoxin